MAMTEMDEAIILMNRAAEKLRQLVRQTNGVYTGGEAVQFILKDIQDFTGRERERSVTSNEEGAKMWNGKKVEAVAAEEINQIQTAEGLRQRIFLSDNNLATQVRRMSVISGYSSEHEALLLAYHALVSMEKDFAEKMERTMLEPNPSFLIPGRHNG